MEMFGLLLFLILLLMFFAAHRAMMDYFEYMIKYDREPPKKKLNTKQSSARRG